MYVYFKSLFQHDCLWMKGVRLTDICAFLCLQCLLLCTCVCLCECVYMHMCVCGSVNMCVCGSVNMCVCERERERECICICAESWAICAREHTDILTDTHTHTHTYLWGHTERYAIFSQHKYTFLVWHL